jgi:hypothetical protein
VKILGIEIGLLLGLGLWGPGTSFPGRELTPKP